MLTDQDMRELLEYKGDGKVLSVYLSTDPEDGGAEVHRLYLRSMLKGINMPADEEVIERYFDHQFDWNGRSAAVFSCAPGKWFRHYTLAVSLRNRIRVSERPHVKPLADLLDAYGGFGVALVDKQGARLFYFHLGELIEQEGVVGETVRQTKRGGASSVPGRRGGSAGTTNFVEETVDRNMKGAAEFAARFFSEHNVRRVLICGADASINPFKMQLPKAWQSLVVGTFSMGMNASHSEVLDRAMVVGQEAERRREAKFIDVVITNAAKGRNAVVGLDDTLAALHEGRIQVLLIQDGLRAPGYLCTGCTHLTSEKMERCPYCSSRFTEIPDAVELAVRQVMHNGGDVEVLHEPGELGRHGMIGALLRY